MNRLPLDATDADLLGYVERWVALLEAEDYAGALALVEHERDMYWTPQLVREVIKRYGDSRPTQKVTLAGRPSEQRAQRDVIRFPSPRAGGIGYVWYDLNVDGELSDLTATFAIVQTRGGLVLVLEDIHVM